jgi:hypothetical protein
VLAAKKVALDVLPRSLEFDPAMVASAVDNLVVGLRSELQRCLSYGRACVEQVRVGDRPIPTPPPEPIAVVPAVYTERKSIFLLRAGKCTVDGEVLTFGRHRVACLPIEIADAAIRHGHAVEPASDVARTESQRDMGGPDYAAQDPRYCADLMQPHKEGPRYTDEHRNPNLHSASDQYASDAKASWISDGREKVGTVSVSHPR